MDDEKLSATNQSNDVNDANVQNTGNLPSEPTQSIYNDGRKSIYEAGLGRRGKKKPNPVEQPKIIDQNTELPATTEPPTSQQDELIDAPVQDFEQNQQNSFGSEKLANNSEDENQNSVNIDLANDLQNMQIPLDNPQGDDSQLDNGLNYFPDIQEKGQERQYRPLDEYTPNAHLDRNTPFDFYAFQDITNWNRRLAERGTLKLTSDAPGSAVSANFTEVQQISKEAFGSGKTYVATFSRGSATKMLAEMVIGGGLAFAGGAIGGVAAQSAGPVARSFAGNASYYLGISITEDAMKAADKVGYHINNPGINQLQNPEAQVSEDEEIPTAVVQNSFINEQIMKESIEEIYKDIDKSYVPRLKPGVTKTKSDDTKIWHDLGDVTVSTVIPVGAVAGTVTTFPISAAPVAAGAGTAVVFGSAPPVMRVGEFAAGKVSAVHLPTLHASGHGYVQNVQSKYHASNPYYDNSWGAKFKRNWATYGLRLPVRMLGQSALVGVGAGLYGPEGALKPDDTTVQGHARDWAIGGAPAGGDVYGSALPYDKLNADPALVNVRLAELEGSLTRQMLRENALNGLSNQKLRDNHYLHTVIGGHVVRGLALQKAKAEAHEENLRKRLNNQIQGHAGAELLEDEAVRQVVTRSTAQDLYMAQVERSIHKREHLIEVHKLYAALQFNEKKLGLAAPIPGTRLDGTGVRLRSGNLIENLPQLPIGEIKRLYGKLRTQGKNAKNYPSVRDNVGAKDYDDAIRGNLPWKRNRLRIAKALFPDDHIAWKKKKNRKRPLGKYFNDYADKFDTLVSKKEQLEKRWTLGNDFYNTVDRIEVLQAVNQLNELTDLRTTKQIGPKSPDDPGRLGKMFGTKGTRFSNWLRKKVDPTSFRTVPDKLPTDTVEEREERARRLKILKVLSFPSNYEEERGINPEDMLLRNMVYLKETNIAPTYNQRGKTVYKSVDKKKLTWKEGDKRVPVQVYKDRLEHILYHMEWVDGIDGSDDEIRNQVHQRISTFNREQQRYEKNVAALSEAVRGEQRFKQILVDICQKDDSLRQRLFQDETILTAKNEQNKPDIEKLRPDVFKVLTPKEVTRLHIGVAAGMLGQKAGERQTTWGKLKAANIADDYLETVRTQPKRVKDIKGIKIDKDQLRRHLSTADASTATVDALYGVNKRLNWKNDEKTIKYKLALADYSEKLELYEEGKLNKKPTPPESLQLGHNDSAQQVPNPIVDAPQSSGNNHELAYGSSAIEEEEPDSPNLVANDTPPPDLAAEDTNLLLINDNNTEVDVQQTEQDLGSAVNKDVMITTKHEPNKTLEVAKELLLLDNADLKKVLEQSGRDDQVNVIDTVQNTDYNGAPPTPPHEADAPGQVTTNLQGGDNGQNNGDEDSFPLAIDISDISDDEHAKDRENRMDLYHKHLDKPSLRQEDLERKKPKRKRHRSRRMKNGHKKKSRGNHNAEINQPELERRPRIHEEIANNVYDWFIESGRSEEYAVSKAREAYYNPTDFAWAEPDINSTPNADDIRDAFHSNRFNNKQVATGRYSNVIEPSENSDSEPELESQIKPPRPSLMVDYDDGNVNKQAKLYRRDRNNHNSKDTEMRKKKRLKQSKSKRKKHIKRNERAYDESGHSFAD